MGGNDKIIVNPNIVLREEFENHVFLYDPDTGDTFPLNPMGVFIWQHLDGRHSVDKLIEKIKQHFENVHGSVSAHIRDFIKDLSKRGFVRE